MLSIFYGTDWKKVNEAAKKELEAFVRKNKPARLSGGDAEVFTLAEDNFSESELERHIASSGLFTGAHAVVVSHLLEHADFGELIVDRLDELATSPNLFIVKQGDLSAKLKKKLGKHTETVKEFVAKQKVEKAPFQIFDLANSLGARDKKNLWLGYHKALREGLAAEEIFNILLWQVRTMSQVSAGATEGIKPFVMGKAKGFLKNYSEKELQDLSRSFVELYHEVRRGTVYMDDALEKLILTI